MVFFFSAFNPPLGQAAEGSGKDEVLKAVKEAVDLYENREWTEAAELLNYAAQKIRQKKGEMLKGHLPDPLKGWTAGEAIAQSAGAAFLGGGILIERKYKKDSSHVTVQIHSDSPLIQSSMMMLSNPMFAQGGQGELERIKGNKAMVKYDAGKLKGEATIVAGKKYLIIVKGNKVQRETIMDYAAGVGYKELLSIP